MKALLQQFVCVLRFSMHDVNLRIFDFDYDLTWWSFFIDANEHVYSRYGGRDADPEGRLSPAGLAHTMQQVLAVHQTRRGLPPSTPSPVVRPLDLFDVKGKCMHCHQVNEAFYKKEKKATKSKTVQPRFLPLPENIGLSLDVDAGNRVSAVKDDSPAARAGIKAGDVLLRMLGTDLLSQGDVMWALQRAPAQGKLRLSVAKRNMEQEVELDLPAGWNKSDLSWRRSLNKFLPK